MNKNAESPPYMRDKSLSGSIKARREGITPTYAGQIKIYDHHETGYRDHPRIRGTNSNPNIFTSCTLGSSPHTRDKLRYMTIMKQVTGIIPAYAGQISSLPLLSHSVRDHPRIRGTNHDKAILDCLKGGSSPHTRDKFRLRLKATGY